MNRFSQNVFLFILVACTQELKAQDLDPRAYARVPVNGTVLITGFTYSKGSVVTDPSIALQDLKATIQVPSLALARTFGFFKMTSQFLVAVPYAWGKASALVNGQPQEVNRQGFSDIRLRWSVLFKGAPAMSLSEFVKAPHKTVLGASINIIAPTGEYYQEKLINLGTNRWSFRPELALSHPFSKKWMFDVYAGVWFFTRNSNYFPGTTVRTQDPLGTIQTHLSYNVNLRTWVAFDATYYAGGNSNLNGVGKNDRQSNSRIGGTLVLPTGRMSSIKFAVSTGAIVRSGANFTTVSIGWLKSFYNMKKQAH